MIYPYPLELESFKLYVRELRLRKSIYWEKERLSLLEYEKQYRMRDVVAYEIYQAYALVGSYDGPKAAYLKREHKYEALRLLRENFRDVTYDQLTASMRCEKTSRDEEAKSPEYYLPTLRALSFAIKREMIRLQKPLSSFKDVKKKFFALYSKLCNEAIRAKRDNNEGWEKKWKDVEKLLASVGLSLSGEKIPVSYD